MSSMLAVEPPRMTSHYLASGILAALLFTVCCSGCSEEEPAPASEQPAAPATPAPPPEPTIDSASRLEASIQIFKENEPVRCQYWLFEFAAGAPESNYNYGAETIRTQKRHATEDAEAEGLRVEEGVDCIDFTRSNSASGRLWGICSRQYEVAGLIGAT